MCRKLYQQVRKMKKQPNTVVTERELTTLRKCYCFFPIFCLLVWVWTNTQRVDKNKWKTKIKMFMKFKATFVLFLENSWILSSVTSPTEMPLLLMPCFHIHSSKSSYQNTKNKCDKHCMSCCLQASVESEQMITRTRGGCLSLEWQDFISTRKESQASFINSVDNGLTDWGSYSKTCGCRCCKHIKTRSSSSLPSRRITDAFNKEPQNNRGKDLSA